MYIDMSTYLVSYCTISTRVSYRFFYWGGKLFWNSKIDIKDPFLGGCGGWFQTCGGGGGGGGRSQGPPPLYETLSTASSTLCYAEFSIVWAATMQYIGGLSKIIL